ncbi:hypothetical protein CR513_02162, partial [Mucuna pruriens]
MISPLYFVHFMLWLRSSSQLTFEQSDLTMDESLLSTSFILTSKLMDSSMKLHAFILHNKMEWLNKRMDILLLRVNLPYLQASPFLLEFLVANKLKPCVVWCVFLGYATQTKGYRFYDPIGNHHFRSPKGDLEWRPKMMEFENSPESEDSSIGIIEHGKATRETIDARTAFQVETDPTALQAEIDPSSI